jgi:alpha-L-fucosidase
MSHAPNYLKNYAHTWETSPKQANLEWFSEANFGLFIHYGLYSQLGREAWVQFHQQIPVAEYQKLAETFNPKNFDADELTDLALEAGMRYVNLTSCHCEGFCLWNSSVESFNAYNAVKRDLVQELAEQCDRKGLGFFTYFSYVMNWHHPYSIPRDVLQFCQPAYPNSDPAYLLKDVSEIEKYWEWSHGCIKELCEIEAPLAGIWLDVIRAYYQRPDLIPVEDTYALIRKLRPEALISYKTGATGTEDFAAPEFYFDSLGDRLRGDGSTDAAKIADMAWDKNKSKHNEICMTLQENGWGYVKNSKHKSADTIMKNLAYAMANNCNLLANIGPLPDGSVHPEDVSTLKEVGRRLREDGYPRFDEAETPSNANGAAAGAAVE